MRWWTPARADGLLALVLTAFGQLNLRIHLDESTMYSPAFGSAVATAAATGVLALRRRAPLLTMVSVAAAISDERSRIARELHDIVAHCVSVMVIQAGAAEDLLDRDPDNARTPLALVQETGRQAVGELSRMLGLLRGSADSPDLGPQPGTADLAELVRHMTEIGLPVELSVYGTPRPLPPGHALTLYRIVQEALTNSLKHAAPTTATVALRYGDQSVEADVCDTGRAAPRTPAVTAGVGHGLIGMRERVNLYAGTLTTGQSPDGGFAVRACLPVEAP